MGSHHLPITGRTGLGGTGSPAQGVVGASCKAYGGPPSSENRAHRPGGDGESSPGGVRSLLPGQWGDNIFGEPGAPAWGGRGVLPRGCSEPPARPTGGHLLQRTGRTGPGGTGSPAQGVFGASCQANGGPSCVVLYCVVLCCVVLCCVVLCCVVLCCVVLCCVVLCCVVPKALLPKGKRPGCLPTGTGKRAGLCVLCARCA